MRLIIDQDAPLKQLEPTPGAIEGAIDDRASDRSESYNICSYMSKVQSDLHQIKFLLYLPLKYVQYV